MADRRKASLDGDTERVGTSMVDEYFQTDISAYIRDETVWLNEHSWAGLAL